MRIGGHGTEASKCLGFPGQSVPAELIARTLRAHEDDPLVRHLAAEHSVTAWTAAALDSTALLQPAAFLASVLRWGQLPIEPSLVIGHSLGEYAALVAAGALEVSDALALVIERGRLCADVNRRRPGAMVAVVGVDEAMVTSLRADVVNRTSEVLDVAAYNGRQIVLSGDARAVERFIPAVTSAGGLCSRLSVPGAFHSEAMAGVLDDFRSALDRVAITAPTTPWMSTIDLQMAKDADGVRERLAGALVRPVRFADALTKLADHGIDRFIDVGPGETLRKLARRRISVETADVGEERESTLP